MAETIRVLYVEDEPDIRELVEFALEEEGFELNVCVSGADALEQARHDRPDLILLDVMMPGMDGPTTLTRLREMSHLSDTPVIFMTAKVQPPELARYRSLGAIDIIVKPFDAMELAGQLRATLA